MTLGGENWLTIALKSSSNTKNPDGRNQGRKVLRILAGILITTTASLDSLREAKLWFRFLINLLISDRSWESISVPFIEESLSRQVSWILLPQNSQPESKQQKPPDIDNDAPFLNDRSRGHFNPRHMLEDGSNKTPLASDVSAVPTQTTNSFDLKKYHPELAHLERDEISTYRLFTTFEVRFTA